MSEQIIPTVTIESVPKGYTAISMYELDIPLNADTCEYCDYHAYCNRETSKLYPCNSFNRDDGMEVIYMLNDGEE